MRATKRPLAWIPFITALLAVGCDEKECVSANDCTGGRACVGERCVAVDDASVDADRGVDPEMDRGIDPRPDRGIDQGVDEGIIPDADVGPPPCVPAAERCDGLDDDCDGLVDEDAPGYPCQPFVLTGGRVTWAAGTSVSADPAHPYRLEGRGRVANSAPLSGEAPGGQRYELREGGFKWVGGIQSASDAPGVP